MPKNTPKPPNRRVTSGPGSGANTKPGDRYRPAGTTSQRGLPKAPGYSKMIYTGPQKTSDKRGKK